MRLLSDKKIADVLRCPICGESMSVRTDKGATLACAGPRTHCYDFAASGYVNMCAPTQSGGGDSKQAVRARSTFLDTGAYERVAQALADACDAHASRGGVLLDAGCGEGYYASFLAQKGFSVIGADLSKFAVDAASKRLARDGYGNFFFTTASVFDLPIKENSIDVVTNVFAPCAEKEFSRILKTDGILAVAWAGERHLWGLKQAIYKDTHINTQREDMPEYLEKTDEIRVRYDAHIESNENIMNLFAMTPYYWRTSVQDREKLAGLEQLDTEIDVMISIYRKTK
jgi:23S rRNA (guanine745-N1)-methyltransferase